MTRLVAGLRVLAGDIGPNRKEIELEPFEEPATAPVEPAQVPAPAEPAQEPVPS